MALVTADELSARQHGDGSFGAQAAPAGRVITTLFAARSLHEAGRDDHPGLAPAIEFLVRHAVVDGGCSIDGRRDGVLSCYTGMLARLLVGTGRLADAEPLLRWLVDHQPVVFAGTVYHQPDAPMWGDYLRHRYGGCMAGTTCLLGLVPAIAALAEARRSGVDVPVDAHLFAMRRLLTDRRVLFGTSGAIFPLAGRTKADPAGVRWLLPAFPRNYLIDLIELVELAQLIEVPDGATEEAVALLRSWQLPDGGWPMMGSRQLIDAYRPEPVDRRRSSDTITRRVRALRL